MSDPRQPGTPDPEQPGGPGGPGDPGEPEDWEEPGGPEEREPAGVRGPEPGPTGATDAASDRGTGWAAGRAADREEGRGPGVDAGPPAPAPGAARRTLDAFRASPYFPATVITLILAVAAALFAGSYVFAMADPSPHHIPTAVVADGPRAGREERREFVTALEQRLGSSLDQRRYDSYAAAKEALEAQEVFAILRLTRARGVELYVASAAGSSVARLLRETAPRVGRSVGVDVTVRDLKPLDRGDPRGLALFYISLAAVITGFIGAIQLSVHARGLDPLERMGVTAAYALLGGFAITAVVDWVLGSVDLPFVHSWMILAFTMFTSGMVFTMFNTLIGRWAMLPTWGLMVLLGNPSSGGAVSWPLLPSPLGVIGRWLPPGASVNAQHTAVYFPGHPQVQPYLTLAGWSVLSCTVFWIWRHRHPGGRADAS